MSDASLPTDSTPKTKKTPVKRLKRAYADDFRELNSRVKSALILLRKGQDFDENVVIACVIALLEGKD